MQERDECCRWNWTVGHRGLQPSRHTQIHNAQMEPQTQEITIFVFLKHPFFDQRQILSTVLWQDSSKTCETNNSEPIEILSGEIIAFEIILCVD